MRPSFQADLINGVFGDPGVYIDLKFQNQAILFDVGDITSLPTRKLLRISDVFVSHTHMDHFAGFDHLLRVCLGRDVGVRLYGPPNFIEQLEHKLHAYTWNLVENYASDFVVTAHELISPREALRARFSSKSRFTREALEPISINDEILLATDHFKVRARAFDHHGLPSLAFAFEEQMHINVWKSRLEEFGLPTGPWLTELKNRVRAGDPDEASLQVCWRDREGSRRHTFSLGELKRVLEFLPGQKACYVTDVADHESNRRGLIEFLRGADLAFIEAVFLQQDAQHAANKAHLTAAAAGTIARAAGVKVAIPFHFSTRYFSDEISLRSEFEAAFTGAHRSPVT
ncbi:MAG TPA: MBL fold metallo-hydrolase [Steroidobacteraceae bacterium]|nr:MBL fold metallo-hydrolase [Steroidobacteraceae bacterium]